VHRDVGYLFQAVAVPSTFCSVCGLSMNSLAQGSGTCQSQSVSQAEDAVNSKQTLLTVEVKELRDSIDSQHEESSASCSAQSVDSTFVSSAVHSVDEDRECVLEDTKDRTQTECLQYDTCQSQSVSEDTVNSKQTLLTVEVKELHDSVDTQHEESSASCSAQSVDSTLVSSAVHSVDEDRECVLEDTKDRTQTECLQYDTCQSQSVSQAEDTVNSKQTLLTVEVKELHDSVDSQHEESSASCSAQSVDSTLVKSAVHSVDEDRECVLDDTKGRREIEAECLQYDTCQSQSVSQAEDTVNSKQTLLTVEVKELRDSVDSQHEESSFSCSAQSVDSTLVSSAVHSVDEGRECVLEDTKDRTEIEAECLQYDSCETQLTDNHISTASEQSVQECFSVAEESSGNRMLSTVENCQFGDESDLIDNEAVAASEELLTQETECSAAVVQVQRAGDETCPASDGHLDELLSCAECGSSGLYFFLFKNLSDNGVEMEHVTALIKKKLL